MKNAFLSAVLLFSFSSVSAQEAAPAVSAAPVSYDYGMAQRKAGDYAGARETFLKLLEQNPDSNGGYEGLALADIGLKRYGEALEALKKWAGRAPHNAYVQGLLLRAANGAGDREAALGANRELAALDPRDCEARARMDSGMARLRGGVFPHARTYRTYSTEGLKTASPQRILYKGNSAGARYRARLKPGLDLIGGLEYSEEAQLNDGRGFTYYDMLDSSLSAGLNGRRGKSEWEAEYGLSALSDAKGSAVGRRSLGTLRLYGATTWGPADVNLTLNSQPKFVRGSGSSKYFVLLRQNSARAEAEAGAGDWDLLGRAGVYATSDGITLPALTLRGLRDYPLGTVQAWYSHGQQEFYSASVNNKLRYVHTDSLSLGLRRGEALRWNAGASVGETLYSDKNRLGELNFDYTRWLQRNTDFYAGYRFGLANYKFVADGYSSVNELGNWLGLYWKHCRGYSWSASAGFERGFVSDSVSAYQANRYMAGLEWYRGSYASVRMQLLKKDNAGRGKGYSAGLQARYSFE